MGQFKYPIVRLKGRAGSPPVRFCFLVRGGGGGGGGGGVVVGGGGGGGGGGVS